MSKMSMADLMNSLSKKSLSFSHGDEVKGTIVSITPTEIILDLGAKSEGVLNRHDLETQSYKPQLGDEVSAYVLTDNNDLGQVLLTPFKETLHLLRNNRGKNSSPFSQDSANRSRSWQKAIQVMKTGGKVSGTIVEVNKGGLVVEFEGIRGFLPLSQIRFSKLQEAGFKEGQWDSLQGKKLSLLVIEVDVVNNRLIFSGLDSLDEATKEKLSTLSVGKTVSAEILAVSSNVMFVNVEGIDAIVLAQDSSWDKVDDLTALYKPGEKIEAKITAIDETTGKVNLSIRELESDPFEELVSDFQQDDVISGVVTQMVDSGINVQLVSPSGVKVEGFLAAEKLEPGVSYSLNQKANFLVDSIDNNRRRVNLAPFITSTVGLIYK